MKYTQPISTLRDQKAESAAEWDDVLRDTIPSQLHVWVRWTASSEGARRITMSGTARQKSRKSAKRKRRRRQKNWNRPSSGNGLASVSCGAVRSSSVFSFASCAPSVSASSPCSSVSAPAARTPQGPRRRASSSAGRSVCRRTGAGPGPGARGPSFPRPARR